MHEVHSSEHQDFLIKTKINYYHYVKHDTASANQLLYVPTASQSGILYQQPIRYPVPTANQISCTNSQTATLHPPPPPSPPPHHHHHCGVYRQTDGHEQNNGSPKESHVNRKKRRENVKLSRFGGRITECVGSDDVTR